MFQTTLIETLMEIKCVQGLRTNTYGMQANNENLLSTERERKNRSRKIGNHADKLLKQILL